MRIVFVTDLHGSQEWVEALVAQEGGAELLLCGGDLTSFAGAAGAARVLAPLRAAFGRVLAVAGNTDREAVLRWLELEGLSLHGRGVALGGLWISGVSGSNETPLRSPLEYAEDELSALLERGRPPEGEGDRPWILVTHVPPSGTAADRMFAGKHVGSTALRSFLTAPGPGPSPGPGPAPGSGRRPAINLCGHIHEGASQSELSGTVVCNPGPLGAGRYVVINVRDGRLDCERRRLYLPAWRRGPAATIALGRKVSGYLQHRVRQARGRR